MSDVTLNIAGRDYVVSCAAGEEEHVRRLGQTIDAKIQSLAAGGGQSEARSLLFASLLLADEVHDLKKRGAPSAPTPPSPDLADPRLADKLEALATRLESCASALEG